MLQYLRLASAQTWRGDTQYGWLRGIGSVFPSEPETEGHRIQLWEAGLVKVRTGRLFLIERRNGPMGDI